MISYAVDVGIYWLMSVYVNQIVDEVTDQIVYRLQWANRAVSHRLQHVGRAQLTVEMEKEQAEWDALDPRNARQHAPLTLEEKGGTVEALVNAMQAYCVDTTSNLQGILLILLFMVFRQEVGIPDEYGIRETDMSYYLYFALVQLGFKFVCDQFLFSALESLWGIKLYEYLLYARYRFLKRETRWKGMERHLDDCIDESHRTLDALAFSSQFYFMNSVATQGLFFTVIGLQIIKLAAWDPAADRATAGIIIGIVALCYVVQRLSVWAANLVGLWRIRPPPKKRSAGWSSALGDGTDELFALPHGEDELAALKAIAAGATPEHFALSAQLADDAFRYRFLDFNRLWLLERLPELFTPRTMARARPYILSQFNRLLGALPPPPPDPALARADESAVAQARRYGAVSLTPASASVLRHWTAAARRRLRMRAAVAPLILKARKPQCEGCSGAAGLTVELQTPLDDLAGVWDAAAVTSALGRGASPASVEVDLPGWRAQFLHAERFRTVCSGCIEKRKQRKQQQREREKAAGQGGQASRPSRDELLQSLMTSESAPVGSSGLRGRGEAGLGPVFLQDPSRALLLRWTNQARQRLGRPPLVPGAAAAAAARRPPLQTNNNNTGSNNRHSNHSTEDDDEEMPDQFERRASVIAVSVGGNPATMAIAQRWLQLARHRASTIGRPPQR